MSVFAHSRKISYYTLLITLVFTPFYPASSSFAADRTLNFPTQAPIGLVYSSHLSHTQRFGIADWKHTHIQRAQGQITFPDQNYLGLQIKGPHAEDLSFLQTFPSDSLEHLSFSDAKLDRPQIQAIAHLSSLKKLTLRNCELTPHALDSLTDILPELENLSLYLKDNQPAPSQLLKWIANRRHLKLLYSQPALDSQAIESLAGHPSLEFINIQIANEITDLPIALSKLPKLSRLTVQTTVDLDPSAAKHFEKLSLKQVRWFYGNIDGSLLNAFSKSETLTKLGLFIITPGDGFFDELIKLTSLEELEIIPSEKIYLETSDLQDAALALPNLRKWPNLHFLDAKTLSQLPGRPIEKLVIHASDNDALTSADLKHIAKLTELRTLEIHRFPFDDQALAQLANLKKLESLTLWATGATGKGFQSLSNLQNLHNITLYTDPRTALDLSTLPMLPALEQLNLGAFLEPSSILKPLQNCQQLQSIHLLEGILFDDSSAEWFSKMTNLKSLSLNQGSMLTYRGAFALSKLPSLQKLFISGDLHTNSIDTLAKNSSLQSLAISTASISPTEISDLQQSHGNMLGLFIRPLRDHSFGLDGIARAGIAESRQSLDLLENQPPPAIEGKNCLTDDSINLTQYQGKVVLLDFWGNWCGPCRAMHPYIEKLHQRFHSSGLEILGIHSQRDADQATAFLEKNPLPWPSILDSDAFITEAYHVKSFPSYFLIDRKGNLRVARIHRHHLEKAIQQLLDEQP